MVIARIPREATRHTLRQLTRQLTRHCQPPLRSAERGHHHRDPGRSLQPSRQVLYSLYRT